MEIVFLNHNFGKDPEENLLLQVQGMIAEYERAKILERSRRGKLYAARRGSVNVLSGAPYGYKYIRRYEGNGEAAYQIILEEAKVVRQVFEWVGRDGYSMGKVCKCLNYKQIPTRTGKKSWDRSVVWAMLKNPAYKGVAAYGKTRIGEMRPRLRAQRGASEFPRRAYSKYDVPEEERILIPVPPIVGEPLYDAVQEQLAENKKRNRQRKRGARYRLQGLLVCNKCGYSYYSKPVSRSAAKGKKRDYVYYRCIGSDAHRFGGQRVCSNRPVRSDFLEQAVWEDVCAMLSNPNRIEEEYHRRLTASKKEAKWTEATHAHTALSKIKRGISRLINSYQDGLLEFTHYWGKSRRGYWVIKRKTARKRLKRTISRIWQWCRNNRHEPLKEQYRMLCLKLRGHYQYYGIRGNYRCLELLLWKAIRAWRYWLSRRSSKSYIQWEKFLRILARYPLPAPRIVHCI